MGENCLAGKRISVDYYVDRIIGKGKNSTVYLIKHGDGHQLAFKSYPLGLLSVAEAEYSLLKTFDHPNIVKAHGFVNDGENIGIILEPASSTLVELVRESSGSPEKGLDFVAQTGPVLLSTIGYVHSKGVVHGDLSPWNVLLDQSQRLLLCDFNCSPQATGVEGRVVRSPFSSKDEKGSVLEVSDGYGAPEQYEGSPPTVQSDLYAIGGILYSLMTGVMPPCRAREPPSHFGAPGWFDMFIAKAMAYKPEERYQSAGEMLLALEKGLAGRWGKEDMTGGSLPRWVVFGVLSLAILYVGRCGKNSFCQKPVQKTQANSILLSR